MLLSEHILSAIAPHECLCCEAEGHVLCAECAGSLPAAFSQCYRCGATTQEFNTCADCSHSQGLRQVFAATIYQDASKDVIYALKFERARAAAADMARLMAARLPAHYRPDIITYVPTATVRMRQRGYDQARLLAQELARQLKTPYAPLLARLTQTRQVGESGAARRAQLEGAFRPLRRHLINRQGVLLVDDVLTTGATLEEAARVLHHSGAAHVDGAVFARV